jgi:hypothetical protein
MHWIKLWEDGLASVGAKERGGTNDERVVGTPRDG